MENYSLTRDHKTILWISCISIGGYATYRYWKKSKLKTIDESFVQMCKVRNCMSIRDCFEYLNLKQYE